MDRKQANTNGVSVIARKVTVKEIKTLISSSLVLVLSLVLLICASKSFSWFSENSNTNAQGMAVSAQVTPNLIIAKDVTTLKALSISDMPFSVSWETVSDGESMLAATRVSDTGSALQYITNPRVIAVHSGLVKSGSTEEPIFAEAVNTAKSTFYVDFQVYIASFGLPMENVELTAHLTSPEDDAPLTHLAATVDFYLGEVADDNYRGTLHLVDAPDASITLRECGTIPDALDDTPILVTMRCYFDGALTFEGPDGTTAYVNTYEVVTDKLTLGVVFVGVEGEPVAD